MNTEQLKQAAMVATPELIADVDPAVILALLECVDALEEIVSDTGECRATVRAAQHLKSWRRYEELEACRCGIHLG